MAMPGAGSHHRRRDWFGPVNGLFPDGTYTGEVSVAVGDVTGDGVDDIAIGTNQGGARARVYRGGDFVKLADLHVGGTVGFHGPHASRAGRHDRRWQGRNW